ncbi:MAG: glycosyltransferase [Ignavibacteriales bacterium]|nr:MAG: glycosyltransferase [Ignavibacteriales bacterium]
MKFTVITAVYNNEAHIEDCIKSVTAQSYGDVEYIIVDGGSTDGTVDIIRRYESRLSKWVSEKDSGIYDALNKGIKLATGDVIVFVHSDDMLASDDVLQKAADVFNKKNCDCVFGDLLYVSRDNTGNVVRYWKSGVYRHSSLFFGWMPAHPAFYVRRKVYDELGLFNTSFRIAADYDIVLRFLHKGEVSAEYVPEVFVKMRTGGASNKSAGNIIRKSSEDYRALMLNGFSVPWLTLFFKNVRKLPQFFKR